MFTDRGAETARETAQQTRTGIPLPFSLAIDEDRLARMWAMTPAQRRRAAERGQLSLGEMLKWASRRPREVPIVGGAARRVGRATWRGRARARDYLGPAVETIDRHELIARLGRGQAILIDCRGPYCAYAHDAVRKLRARGHEARRLEEGWPEWRLAQARPREHQAA